MSGFHAEIKLDHVLHSNTPAQNSSPSTMEGPGYIIHSLSNNKFPDDCIFINNDSYLIVLDGVIHNKNRLMTKHKSAKFFETVITMYETSGERFIADLRGSFCGILFDKRNMIWVAFNNHIGDKPLYFITINNELLIGSEAGKVFKAAKGKGLQLQLDESSAYALLTYGYLLGDHTIVKGINRLLAGKYLRISSSSTEVCSYHEIRNTSEHSLTETDMIDGLDTRFREAVRLGFEKDLEYGYNHVATLSGGFDSRMTVWVAHELGFKEITAVTYSQPGYRDARIAEQIVSHLAIEWIFLSLGTGKSLIRMEEIVEQCPGNAIHVFLANGLRNQELINFSTFGQLHTGMLGDVIIGSYNKSPHHQKCDLIPGNISPLAKEHLAPLTQKKYDNFEMLMFHERGLNGILQGHITGQLITEPYSPFLDIDFLDFCFRIPVKYRFDHKIYAKWVTKKYPMATKFTWEKVNAPINVPRLKILGKDVPVTQLHSFGYRYLNNVLYKLKIPGFKNSSKMVPLDFWYSSQPKIRDTMDSYFKNTKGLTAGNSDLFDFISSQYMTKAVLNKATVLTLLATMSKFEIQCS